MKKRIGYFLFSLLFLSCAKEVDFGMLDDLRVRPGATVPLLRANLSLEDLVGEDNTILQIDSNEALRVYFRQDSIFSYSNQELIRVPNQEPIPVVLDSVLPFSRLTLELGTLSEAEFFDLFFASGKMILEVEADSGSAVPVDFKLTWHNARLNGQNLQPTFSLGANQTELQDSVSLADVELDLTDGGQKVNFLDFELSIENPSAIPSGAKYNCKIILRDLEVDAATGFFGNRIVNAPSGDFLFSIPGLDRFAGGFSLENPSFKFFVNSSVGVPLDLYALVTGENRDLERVALEAPVFQMMAPPAPGQDVTNVFSLNAANSNVVDFLSLIPQKFLYSGYVELNPQGKSSNPNFVTSNSSVNVDFEADIPLKLKLQNMRFRETIEPLNLNIDQADVLESLKLYFRSENEIPFDLNLRVAFLDSLTGDSIHGTAFQVLRPAEVNAEGRVVKAYQGEEVVELDSEQIDAFLRSNGLRFEARLSTDQQGQQVAKLYADYSLQIEVAVEAKASIMLNEL